LLHGETTRPGDRANDVQDQLQRAFGASNEDSVSSVDRFGGQRTNQRRQTSLGAGVRSQIEATTASASNRVRTLQGAYSSRNDRRSSVPTDIVSPGWSHAFGNGSGEYSDYVSQPQGV
jgi:hypothetical protein